jgi:drug/metabolite transporter (DMT)-like permease
VDPLAPGRGSLGGVSPLPWAITWRIGLFGGLLYATLAYSGFAFAPADHASVLLPGSLPLWTTLLALLLLGERIRWGRALGLGLIVCGDALVGGASLLNAFDGSGVWRGDVLFVLAAMCWSMYSVLVRRFALDAVQATIGITAFAFVMFVPAYTLACLMGWLPGQVLHAPWREIVFQMGFQGVGSVVVSGIGFTKNDSVLRPGAFHHDDSGGARPVCFVRSLVFGRAPALERVGWPGAGQLRHCVWRTQSGSDPGSAHARAGCSPS